MENFKRAWQMGDTYITVGQNGTFFNLTNFCQRIMIKWPKKVTRVSAFCKFTYGGHLRGVEVSPFFMSIVMIGPITLENRGT